MLDTLVALAQDAADVILEIYQGADLGAQRKGDGSPVTAADGAAEALILAGLGRAFPDIPVIAEEAVSAGRIPEVAKRFFLVDPLDGTAEFIRRSGEFTVNIGLIEAGAPTVGVVLIPTTGEIFVGDARGARRGRPTTGGDMAWEAIHAVPAPAPGLRVIASRRSLNPETEAYLARFDVAETIRASSSLKLCRLAEGAADLYPRMAPTSAWDIAAGDAVLRAAGGMVRTLDGQPLIYGPNAHGRDSGFLNPYFVASGAFDPDRIARPVQ